MQCEYCSNEIPVGAKNCPACGAPAPVQAVPVAPVAPAPMAQPMGYAPMGHPSVVVVNNGPQAPYYPYPPKSRATYILLAVLFGALGVHNFYARRSACGIIQLLITILSCGVAGFISWIWAVIEACTVTGDANNIPFN